MADIAKTIWWTIVAVVGVATLAGLLLFSIGFIVQVFKDK